MNLARFHQIDLLGLNFVFLKIDLMPAHSRRNEYELIEIMLMRKRDLRFHPLFQAVDPDGTQGDFGDTKSINGMECFHKLHHTGNGKFVLFEVNYGPTFFVGPDYNGFMKALFLLLFFTQSLLAASSWHSNIDHSEIFFKVPYLSVSELTGRFNEFSAVTTFSDEKIPENIEISIRAASIDTSHKLRDGHLKGSDFFNTTEYPEIIFRGNKITRLKNSEFKVEGYLKIKNVTKLSTIAFSITDSVKDTWGYENKFVKFSGKLNRKDYNIKWNKTLDEEKYLVGDEITFWGVFQLQPAGNKTPPSKHMIPDTEYIREREKTMRKNEEESSFSQKLRKLINGK